MKQIYSYNDIQAVLEQLLQEKESSEVEFKSAAGGFPKSFWETYSSFANTNGGAIIFGVKEKSGEFYLDGLTSEQVEKYKRDFFNNMHSKQNISIALLKEEDVQDIEFKGSHFLFFYIPRVDRNFRPVFQGLDPRTGTFRRDIEGDYRCSPEEVNSMFADANIANPADGRILKNYGKEDLDEQSIKQYRRKFEQYNPDHVWNTLSEDEFLQRINVFRKDRKTGEYGLTYAGLLMFGTYSAIMDENPNFFPDYQEIQNPKDRWVNRIYPDGNWESNLFQFYSRVLPVLQNFLPKPFKLEGNARLNETPAHVAIREALANALAHADYSVNASLNIYKYPNRIVISNPGTMLISIKQYYQGGESVCRNKYLQNMFMFLSSAEKAGSGADKIIHGWEDLNWKRPYVTERNRPNKVVLTLPMESLLDEFVLSALTGIFGSDIERLPRIQLQTLALAYSEEEITNERLQYALDLHRTDITHLLNDMCKKNLLVATGYGRGTKYHVSGLNVERNMDTTEANMDTSEINMDSSGKEQSDNMDTLEHSMDSSVANVIPRRYNKKQLIERLSEICSEWRTAEEIANMLGRDLKYIKNFVLPKMSDVLEKMYDIPHHPRQKYRVRPSEK